MWKVNQKFNWLAIAGLLVMLMFAGSVQAQELTFEETFDDPNLPGWDFSPGVGVEGGVMRVGPGAFVIHHDGWANARIVAQVRMESEGEFVFGTRVGGEGAYLLLVGREYAVLQREVGGELAEIAAAGGIPIPYQDWFQLELLLEGGYLQIFINESLVIEVEDPAPLPAGGILFETLGGMILEIEHLAVYAFEGGSPPPEEGASPSEPGPPAEQGEPITFSGDLTWVRTGGPLGGLGYDVRMHPGNPDIMYVTDAYAGVFKSTDGGKTWFPSNQGITVRTGTSGDAIPIFCLTMDPTNPDTIWVGTQHKRGIFKSTDGGANWVMKVNGIVEKEGITFRGIAIDPKDPQVIYAAAELSSWAWAGQEQIGREFDKVKGVVYKSTNGGENWQAVWRGDNLARYILIDPRDSNVLYVSTGIFDREAANSDHASNNPGGVGVLKSTDGGQTWTQMNNGLTNLYIGTLFMHPTNPDILLAGAANNAYREGVGVFLTTDGAQTWTRVLEQEAQSVEFSTSDPTIAYAGNPGFIFSSNDTGSNWELMLTEGGSWGSPGVTAGFPIDFQVDPRNPDRFFANNYGGGNFLTEDGGRTWMDASAGYTGAQVRALAASPTEPGVIYAAARSGIFVSINGGANWEGLVYPEAYGLEWNAVAIDPTDPLHVLGANNWSRFFGESMNGGLSWMRKELSLAGEMQGSRVIVFSPSDSEVVYAGFGAFYSAGTFDNNIPASGVYVSNDGGSQWSSANDGQTANANVSGLAVHPTDSQTVLMASPASGLFKTADGGSSWIKISSLPGGVRPLSIAFDPGDPNLILMGSEGRGLFRSVDGGQAWSQVYAGLPAEAVVTTILFHPATPGTVFCGDAFSGVYRSEDSGQTWLAMSNGLRTRAVNALALSADGWHLYAGTEGEGVFRLDFKGQPPGAGQPLMKDTTPEGEPPGEEPSSPLEPPEGEPEQTGEEQPPISPPASSSRNMIFGIVIGVLAVAILVGVVLLVRQKRT